ncbi:MAG TPA: VWA domain-containing protein [Polyangiales bacterium]
MSARAQSAEDILPLTNDPNDPIGVDHEAASLDRAAVSGTASKPTRTNVDAFGPEPPPFSARAGEVLTAVPSLHEKAHRVSVELSAGLANVDVELEFENGGDKPAELSYRLPVPDDAALGALEVCGAHGCRPGIVQDDATRLDAYDDALQARPSKSSAALPIADARKLHDERGDALVLRAAPVSKSERLRLHIQYISNAIVHGGMVRFTLPAAGMDPRLVPIELSVRAPSFVDVRVDDLPIDSTSPRDAFSPIEISARAALSGENSAWRVPCANAACVRAYFSAAAIEKPVPVDLVLAIDASPSTEGSARSRFIAAVAAILARAPPGSRVRALRFASRATPLVLERKDARDLSLRAFAPIAFEAELGAATRFEAAWSSIEHWGFAKRGRRLVVILGDGGLTTGPARPFEAARRAGVEVAVVNVADRPSAAALVQGAQSTGGAVIDAGAEADAVVRRAPPERLEERVAALFQPNLGRVRPPHGLRSNLGLELRAGDSVLVEGRVAGESAVSLGSRTFTPSAAPRALASALAAHADPSRKTRAVAVDRADIDLPAHGKKDRPEGQDHPPVRGIDCDRRGPAQRVSGLSSDAAPVALAEERALCIARPAAKPKPNDRDADEVGAGMPSSPLLSMLRQRILPVARGCFRRDRAGRADYQVRAVFEFELADREVLSAHVEGKIADALRACLLDSIDSLAVPRFSGKVVVRYPLVTERETLPAQIELTATTADRLDALIGPH